MREILFRGKRIDNGEWVEGYYKKGTVIAGDRAAYIADIIVEAPTKPFGDCLRSEVEPDTVGQYTGLNDKDGRRIYEGDIVVYDNSPYNAYCTPQKGEIIWRRGSLCFKYIPWNSAMYRALCSDDFFAAKCEVIGNIHDNPELLGVKCDG